MPKTTPAKKSAVTVGLLIRQELTADWFHLKATPVIIGMTRRDLDTIDHGGTLKERVDPDRVSYFDAYDTHNGLFFDGLQVYSQGTNSDTPRRLYAVEVRYHDVCLTAENAPRYARTLATIAARMDKHVKTLGHPIGFAQYAARVALAIGATRFAFTRTGRSAQMFGENSHRVTDIADGLYAIQQLEREWINAGAPATV